MKKLLGFVSFILAGYLVFQFHEGMILANDVFGFMNNLVVSNQKVDENKIGAVDLEMQNSSDEERGESIEKSGPVGGIISSKMKNPEALDEYFENLSKNSEFETLIILAENENLKGRYNFAINKFGYNTEFGWVEPDLRLFSELAKNFSKGISVGYSYLSFEEDEDVKKIAISLKKYFPEAKILPIKVKSFANEPEIKDFAEILTNMDEDVFIVSNNTFSEGFSNNVAAFHLEQAESVIRNLDKDGLAQMDVDFSKNLRLLFEYLDLKDAEITEDFMIKSDEVGSGIFAQFQSGKNQETRDLTILAFGDIMLGRHVRVLMDSYGQDYVFDGIKGPEGRFFEGVDIVHANLEGPIQGLGKKGGTSMNFAFNEDVAPLLARNGFNLLSLANNHALDQGWPGRESTISALNNAGVDWCGHPSEPDYDSVYFGEVDEKTFAFVCFQDITHVLDDKGAIELIKKVDSEVDFVIVSIHWGYEYKHQPAPGNQVEPAHAFIDAGADFVIGHHPHVVETFEIYNGKFIFYSLGNFIFDQYWSIPTQQGLSIGIVLNKDDYGKISTKVYLFPMRSDRSQSKLMTGEERAAWLETFVNYGNYSEELKLQIKNGVLEF